jgi:DHA1 family bicyclomycin/chloramphenicol resistance-like MFS transporter
VLGAYLFAAAGWEANFHFLTAAGMVLFVAVLATFPETLSRQDRRPAHPLAVLRTYGSLFAARRFLAPALGGAAAMAGLFSYISASPFVFVSLHHLSPRRYGWLFGGVAAAAVLAGQLNRVLLRRAEPRTILGYALSINIAAGVILVLVCGSRSIMPLLPPLWIFIGCTPVITANFTAMAMEPTHGKAGTASSLLGALQWASASLVGLLIGVCQNGGALPMAMSMLVCALLGGASFLLTGANPRAADQDATPYGSP